MKHSQQLVLLRERLIAGQALDLDDIWWLIRHAEQQERWVDAAERGQKYQFEKRKAADERAAVSHRELRRKEAEFSTEVDRLRDIIVELWHEPEQLNRPLHEVLGMTIQEYGCWAVGATHSYGW